MGKLRGLCDTKVGSVRHSPVNLGGRDSTQSVFFRISSLLQPTVSYARSDGPPRFTVIFLRFKYFYFLYSLYNFFGIKVAGYVVQNFLIIIFKYIVLH